MKDYFNVFPLIDVPSYNDAFENIVGNYFEKIDMNLEIQKSLEQKEILPLMQKIEAEGIFTDASSREYIILFGLTKLFYTGNYKKKEIVSLLTYFSYKTTSSVFKDIANDFIERTSLIMQGNPAPEFSLPAADNSKKSLSQFSGKFVYLNFFKPENYTAEKEMALLQNLNSQKIDLLEIVTIWCGGTKDEMKNYVEKNNYSWTFLYCNDEQLLKTYDVRAFPTYFLIDPESTLIAAPAGSPEYNFEAFYYQAYQNRKNELLRRKDKKLNNN
jgi:peroxiredoxin